MMNTEQILNKFLEVCTDLNIDEETKNLAWCSYNDLIKSYSINCKYMTWICCAIYTASQDMRLKGLPNQPNARSSYSLSHLLRSCNVNIYEFLDNLKCWCNMSEQALKYQPKVIKMNRKLNITTLVFQRYEQSFKKFFRINDITTSVPQRKRQKFSYEYNSSNVYDMCWLLFVCIKSKLPELINNLLETYYLLICCMELIYRSVLNDKRTDIILLDLSHLKAKTYITTFCKLMDTIPKNIKVIQERYFKIVLKHFYNINILYGDKETFVDIAQKNNFNRNLKSLSNKYTHYIIATGDFDERIMPNCNLLLFSEETSLLAPITALTEFENILKSDKVQSAKWIKYIKSMKFCMADMSNKFFKNFKANNREKYLVLTQSLYYYLLDKIVCVEVNTKHHINRTQLMQHTNLRFTLFTCCTELVLWTAAISEDAEMLNYEFPWVLKCFDTDVYQFYKIIEIIVLRHDYLLTRQQIRHLSFIEEQCLSELVWCKNTQLWQRIQIVGALLPSCQEVHSTTESTMMPTSLKLDKQPYLCDRSLKIFFRKIYTLSWQKLNKLCDHLPLPNSNVVHIIWHILEHSLTHYIMELLRGRHLDQLIMCAIYIYIRKENLSNITFTDIIGYYRLHPQAKSCTYRKVLLNSNRYGDIIEFYNQHYVPKMQLFVNYKLDQLQQKIFCSIVLPCHEPKKDLLSQYNVNICGMQLNLVSETGSGCIPLITSAQTDS